MAFRVSNHPKKWPKTTKIIKQNEQGVASELKEKKRALATAETDIKDMRTYLKAAEPALEKLRPIPDALDRIGYDFKQLNAQYAETVAQLLALESQIEDESDEKKKKKLIVEHKKADAFATTLDTRVNSMVDSLRSLMQEGNRCIGILG